MQKQTQKETVIIDATDHVLGRLASYIANNLLKNTQKEIIVVNAKNALIVGKKNAVLRKFLIRKEMHAKGNPLKGPKFYRFPDRIFWRAVKGMLPIKKARGRNALKRLKVYIGIPKELKGKESEFVKVEQAIYKGIEKAYSLNDISFYLSNKRF